MVRRVLLIGIVATLGAAAQAEEQQAATPEANLVPVVTREVCTTTNWGFEEIRTDCRMEVSPAPKGNPALKGICTTYYGRRACY